ncbi:MAG: hypothetical protein ACK58X_17815 [Planctomycetota bacterium]
MMNASFSAVLLSLSLATAQTVAPPFNADYVLADLGIVPNALSYGGTAFLPGNPNVLLVSPWPGTSIRQVPLVRDSSGYITGAGPSTIYATVGGTDGGLVFGPGNVLFATWYGPNRLSQLRPGSVVADRVDDLSPLGVANSVGACAFVPAGMPGAGRFKVASYNASMFYDLPLTPDGQGTFAPGQATSSVALQGGPEGLCYVPNGAPQVGGRLLVTEYNNQTVVAYQIDAIGNPVAGTRQVVIPSTSGYSTPGGGAIDPVTGDIVFLAAAGRLLALRSNTACGGFTAYGVASPGALGTPTITGSGCARSGQSVALQLGGPAGGLGVLATGGSQLNVPWNGLTVLQSLDVLLVSVLDASGQGGLSLGIPANPLLANARLYFQAAYFDASTPSGFSASAGLGLLIR